MNDDHNKPPMLPDSGIKHDFLSLMTYQAKQGSDYRNIYGNGEPADKQQSSQAIAKAVQGALDNIHPKDDFEAMLEAQSIAVHNATMQCFMRAAKPDASFRSRQSDLNQAGKLSRTYAMLMDTINRHRGKGGIEQRIIVQYVNVADGGQAIVGGSVTPAKGGGHPKNEEPPHAK